MRFRIKLLDDHIGRGFHTNHLHRSRSLFCKWTHIEIGIDVRIERCISCDVLWHDFIFRRKNAENTLCSYPPDSDRGVPLAKNKRPWNEKHSPTRCGLPRHLRSARGSITRAKSVKVKVRRIKDSFLTVARLPLQ